MKTLFLILGTVLSINCAYSLKRNESQVPAPVNAKFQSLHADIKNGS
jgi:hypothetical protein